MTSQPNPVGDPARVDGAEPALEVVGMTKRFGATTALDDVRLRVEARESHALVGRNGAGKSTLVSIVTGLQAADSGSVRFGGRLAPSLSDRDGWRRSVACVYQRSTIIGSLSVAENIFLNRQQISGLAISWKKMRARAQSLVDEWDIGVDVSRTADVLTVEQRQMVEIARALAFGATFIILDEPTAQLDSRGIDRLFHRLRVLQEHGVAYLFISHHLQEIWEICQSVTVFRDAKHILTAPVSEMDSSTLVQAMTGDQGLSELADRQSTIRTGAPVLQLDALFAPAAFADVSLSLQRGEVLGITGSGSSGRLALAETIVGLRKAGSGRIVVDGCEPRAGSVPAALAAGIGFVPRDRHHEGLVDGLSLAENITMTIPKRLGRFGFISPVRRDRIAREAMAELAVVASGPEQPAGSLSGGNQQKIVMGRALADRPKVLVLMHPTAGVDVRSKTMLLSIIDRVRATGTGVVIVSDELDDLRPCDRVLVMLHGRISGEYPRGWQDSDIVAATEGVVATTDHAAAAPEDIAPAPDDITAATQEVGAEHD